MRSMRWAGVLVALIFTAVVDAGQIYGTIVSDGKGVASASIEIKCGTAESVTGSTAADGVMLRILMGARLAGSYLRGEDPGQTDVGL